MTSITANTDKISARANFRAKTLRRSREQKYDAVRSTTNSYGEERETLLQAEAQGRQLANHPNATASQLKQSDANVEECKEAVATANTYRLKAEAVWDAAARLDDAVNRYLAQNANNVLEDVSIEPKQTDTLAHLDAKRDVFKANHKGTNETVTPIASLNEQIAAFVAKRGLPARLSLEKGRVSVLPPLALTGHSEAGGLSSVADALALVAYYMPQALVTDLQAQAAELVKGKVQLDPAEKAKRLAAIDAELLELDMLEGELAWRRFAETDVLEFRPGLDPRALLGVRGPKPRRS